VDNALFDGHEALARRIPVLLSDFIFFHDKYKFLIDYKHSPILVLRGVAIY
jgi:hypothetical protein